MELIKKEEMGAVTGGGLVETEELKKAGSTMDRVVRWCPNCGKKTTQMRLSSGLYLCEQCYTKN